MRLVMAAGAAVFVVVLLPMVWELFSPFIIGLAVAALLKPLITLGQEKLHMKRGLAVALWVTLVIVVAFLLLYWFVSFAVVQLISVAENAPGLLNTVTDALQSAADRLLGMAKSLPDTVGATIQTSLDGVFQNISDAGMRLAGSLVNGTVSFAAGLPYAFVYANFLVLAIIFITNRYERMEGYFKRKKPRDESGIGVLRQSAGKGAMGYIRVQLLFSLLTCLISWVYFQTLGFRYAFLIGFLAAILELIPQFGCGTLYIPWSIVCFVVGQTRNGWLVLGLYLGYSLLRRVTEPALLGSNLGVSPLYSLMGMFVGMRMGGILGLILGPVVMVVLVAAVRAHLFDGLVRDLRIVFDHLTSRWQRGLPKEEKTDG